MDQKVLPGEGYLLALEPLDGTVRVELGGDIIAESERVIALHESRLIPAYYFPMEDVRAEFLASSQLTSLCAFKGGATYWSLKAGNRTKTDAAWGYNIPDDNVAAIAGHVAFYWDRMDAWYLNGYKIKSPERDAEPRGINPQAQWLMHGAWNAKSTDDLVYKFCRGLVEYGIPIHRFRLIIRTLHPHLDIPVLDNFPEEGATDYVAMPMVFSDGQVNAISL